MALACFIHHDKYASQWQWITVSGVHEAMRNYMPLWSKKKGNKYGIERICLDGRTVRAVRKPLGFTLELGAKIRYIIAACEEVSDVKIVNLAPGSTREKEKYLPFYINISAYEKRTNVLASTLERVTAYATFSLIFTAAKTAAQLKMGANQIKRDLGMKDRRISLTLTSFRQDDTMFVVKDDEFTFGMLAEMLKEFSAKEKSVNEIRKVLDELYRNGVQMISQL